MTMCESCCFWDRPVELTLEDVQQHLDERRCPLHGFSVLLCPVPLEVPYALEAPES